MRSTLPKAFFLLSYGLAIGLYVATVPGLPESMPARFGTHGEVAGYMTRGAYLLLMVGLTLLLPLVLLGTLGRLPRSAAHLGQRLAPSHPQSTSPPAETLALLETARWWMAGSTALFMGLMHWMIVQAGATTPAHLAMPPFLALVGVFSAMSITFAVWMSWRVRRA